MISAAVLAVAVGPVQAAPADDPKSQIPNTGADPVPSGELQLPGGLTPPAAPQLSPLAQRMVAEQTRLEQMGEQLKQKALDHASARTNLALADREWRAASERLAEAERKAQDDAAKAYKAAAELPPDLGSNLRNLGALSAVPDDDPPGFGSVRDLIRAQQEERDRYQAYSEAIKTEQMLASEYLALQAEFKKREAAYLALRQQHADQLAEIEREREAREQRIGEQYIRNGALNGFGANPRALEAVKVALKQLGDPYVWGAEGPNSFDCSGLMWYSYYHGAQYSLPRVAKDQYYATRSRTVSRYALLPGDLIFFASNPNDWTTVHHVGMYLGKGKMIHAPHTGDVVKIATVWWSEFFAATRVLPEVVAPGGNGSTPPPSGGNGSTPSPGNGSKPPPTGGGSTSPTPGPGQSTKPPVSVSPSPPTSPTSPPSESPSESPSTPPSSTPSSPSAEPTSAPADPPGDDPSDDPSTPADESSSPADEPSSPGDKASAPSDEASASASNSAAATASPLASP
jgi:cell wall-associated NlpC family hydrolase